MTIDQNDFKQRRQTSQMQPGPAAKHERGQDCLESVTSESLRRAEDLVPFDSFHRVDSGVWTSDRAPDRGTDQIVDDRSRTSATGQCS
jgi:hypothetical protein